jgi:hypothetical protein
MLSFSVVTSHTEAENALLSPRHLKAALPPSGMLGRLTWLSRCYFLDFPTVLSTPRCFPVYFLCLLL